MEISLDHRDISILICLFKAIYKKKLGDRYARRIVMASLSIADGLITMTESESDSPNSISTTSQISLLRAGHNNSEDSQNTSNVDDQETPNFEINNKETRFIKKGVRRFK